MLASHTMQPVPDAWVNLITPWATWLRCPQVYTRSNNEAWLLHNKNGSACVLVCAFPALTLRSYPHYCDKKEHVQGDESLFLNIYPEVAWLIELCINSQSRLYKAALIDGLWHLSSHLSKHTWICLVEDTVQTLFSYGISSVVLSVFRQPCSWRLFSSF